MRTAIAALTVALTLPAAAAQAADAAALKVLGFSPDGRYFGFMQYGPQWEAGRMQAEVFVIDVSRDRFVPSVPLRVTAEMKEDTTGDNVGPVLKKFLANAEKRAAIAFSAQKLSKAGTLLARDVEARAAEHRPGSEMPPKGEGAAAVAAKHTKLGELNLKLETKTMDWPKTSRHGSHKEASSCAEEMDPEKGVAFRLTLDQGGRTVVLQDDKTIPASRNCVSGYGIVEVHAYDRPDGKVTLAAILGMHTRGFEGADRVFLAVTKVLER